MKKVKNRVIIPVGMKPYPKPHEISAAGILAEYFRTDVNFVKTLNCSTPDVSIRGVVWEIKSPIGDSRNNIRKHMREASHQSRKIVIDLRRSKLHQTRAIGYVKQYLLKPNRLVGVLIITKLGEILVVK